MTSDPEHIVVVGASLAGLRMIETVRRAGYAGRITVIGDEPHLPYDRPPLSKKFLTDDAAPDVSLRAPEKLGELDAVFELGVAATALDPVAHTVTVESGEVFDYDAVVLATGAMPRRLPDTDDLGGVHVLRTIEDAQAIRAALDDDPRVVVVGGGFIGAEIAASIRTRGGDVTIVEFLDQPLLRGLGPDLGAVAADWYRARGVDLRLGTAVTGFTANDGRVTGVEVDPGGTVPAELVVVGIGVVPATDWLEGSGLTIANGVVCDEYLAAVGVDDVWVVGDIARWPHPRYGEAVRLEHWTSATETASAVAANLLARARGENLTPHDPVPYVWSDQFDTKIQIAGHIGVDDTIEVVRGSTAMIDGTDPKFVALAHRDGQVTGIVGFSEPRRVVMAQMALQKGPLSVDDARDIVG